METQPIFPSLSSLSLFGGFTRATTEQSDVDASPPHIHTASVPVGGGKRTYEDATALFKSELLPRFKPSAKRRYLVSLVSLDRFFAGFLLVEITTVRLQNFIMCRRSEGVQDATIRRDLACLSSIFSLVKSLDWVATNPVRDPDNIQTDLEAE